MAETPAGRKKNRRKVILRLFIVVLLLIASFATAMVLLGPAERKSELSAYGNSWDDISRFRKNISDMNVDVMNIISSPTLLDLIDDPVDRKNTVFIAIGIEKKYTLTEAWAIYDFFLQGGKVIIADDFGYGNSVSDRWFSEKAVGFGVEFINSRLWESSNDRYDKNPLFVKVAINSLGFHGTILMNEPTAFHPGKDSMVRAYSSPGGASWIDSNGNEKRDPEEYMSASRRERGFPLIYEMSVMSEDDIEGKALFLSDPSIFLNDMWDRYNNSAFCAHLVKYLLGDEAVSSGKATVIFDESRHYEDSPVSTIRREAYGNLVLLVTDTNLRVLTPVILVMFLLILIIVVDNPPRLRHKFDIKHMALYNLRTPKIFQRDADRIRALFLEKIRMASGMNMDDFREISASELAEMVGDGKLTEFLLDWDQSYSINQLENLLVVIRDWKPPTFPGGDEYLD